MQVFDTCGIAPNISAVRSGASLHYHFPVIKDAGEQQEAYLSASLLKVPRLLQAPEGK